MVDRSWGGTAEGAFRVRTNESGQERADARARDRQARVADREAEMAKRSEDRAAARLAERVAQETSRIQRRDRERLSAGGDVHAAAAMRHRSSGRKDVVKEERDTRAYATVVDEDRIRALSKKGASLSALAAAFGVGTDRITAILASQPRVSSSG